MDGLQFPCSLIQFLQFLAPVSNSKMYLRTGTVNDPVASILFSALKSVSKTSLNLLKYCFFNLSFSNLMLCHGSLLSPNTWCFSQAQFFNPLNPELNPICYLLALLGAHHFLHVSRIRVKLLTFRLLMLYVYGAPILDVSRSHTTTQHSR